MSLDLDLERAVADARALVAELDIPTPAFRRPLRYRVVVGATVGALILGGLWIVGQILPSAAPPVVSQVPSTTHPANLLPANGWVAYTVEPGGDHGDIWMVKDGEEPRAIIGAVGDDITTVCPSFSPDGTMLAYSEADWRGEPGNPWPTVAGGEPYGVSTVVVVAIDGSGSVAPLIRIPAAEALPPTPEIAAMPGYGRVCPKWSADGRFIAYEAANQSDGIKVVGLDGDEATLSGPWMSPNPSDTGASTGVRAFQWSPSSTEIAVVSASGLWLVPVDDGEPLLLNDGRSFTSLSWSPDGSQLAVSFTVVGGNPEFGRIQVAEGSPLVRLGSGRDAIWSPDGAWIAYSLDNPPDGTELMIFDPITEESREVASPPSFQSGGPTWSPDGGFLVIVKHAPNTSRYGLTSVSIEPGSTPVELVSPTEDLYDTNDHDDISWQPIYP